MGWPIAKTPERRRRCIGKMSLRKELCLMGLAPLMLSGVGSQASDTDIEALQQRVDQLTEQLRQLETRAAPRRSDSNGTSEPDPHTGTMSEAVPGSERVSDEHIADVARPDVRIGGALRFNYVHQEFSDASNSKYGQSGLDVFRLNVDGQIDNILISAEYRFYSYMHTLKHGWLGYEFSDDSQLQFGVHQVPFGLLPYAAHNAWFGVPYYIGLADNYDMGVKYQRDDGPWNLALAFYKNEELNDPGNPDRYAFDLIQGGDQQNEQINKANARLAYTFGSSSGCETELGGSVQGAQVYNAATDRRGDHWAAAAHLDSRCGRWNFQLQGLRYHYDPENPDGVDGSAVQMGAFGGTYAVASEADVVVANVAYNIDSPWEGIDQLICYNDYSHMRKTDSSALDSKINTLGCAIGSGPLFTYVDYIFANNMAYFDNGSMAGGGEDKWRGRLNINIGFYW